ncbi:hypothetical protein LZ554_006439 [Drepanopeziza brunnea f. sp. 'monogermtubi']|nr:hypothetical protein LZ554_006439 [Drepanopeziza brunnea f. sp. 'monogermtubi']
MLQQRTPTFAVGILVGLFVLFIVYSKPYSFSDYPSHVISPFTKTTSLDPGSSLDPVTNATLGFERVFAIGLAERSDKRDALALISSLTGFKIEWVDGVRGESVVDKALPYGVNRTQLWESNLGSWRGHMNAIRKIVEEGITTALIMEDDMDWDVRLKDQLQLIAAGTSSLQSSSNPPFTSPYGDDWDILWLGHCGEVFPETLPEYATMDAANPDIVYLSKKYTIHDDPTVPPPAHTAGFQNYTAHPSTRWVHVTGGPICSFAYALSLEGARKVLYDLSVDHLVGPFDNALAGLCRWGRDPGRLGMRCFTVTPPVFMHHRAKGNVNGDSDIQVVGGGGLGNLREVGTTENMVWSARLNTRAMIMGDEMKSQWED